MAATWSELRKSASAEITPAEAKQLPIAFVLEKAGVQLEGTGDGVLHACCPFHPDSSPSFDVYGEKLERWGCFPCGLSGDVLDLIMKLNAGMTFPGALAWANVALREMADTGWKGPTIGTKKKLDIEAVRARVTASRIAQTGAIDAFLEAKQGVSPGLSMDAAYLREFFGLGEEGANITIPYWDRAHQPVTMKYRTADTKPISVAGSSFGGVLYAEWLDYDLTKPVVLCEGESDVWAVHHAVSDTHAVLGLPTGAGSHPKQAELLKGRTVLLAFDGDVAGRASRIKWMLALNELGCEVLLVPVPDGYDMAGLSREQIIDVIGRARQTSVPMPGIVATASGYKRLTPQTETMISNFTFTPHRELIGDEEAVYEGSIYPSGEVTTISTRDFYTFGAFTKWCNQHSVAFSGRFSDVQVLLSMLQAEGPMLSVGRMTSVAGLHSEHFIFPGGSIGPDYWRYVPPPANIHLENLIDIKGDPWSPSIIHSLRSMHDSSVMDPMLAWLAAAPIRSMLREFPILAVTGSSGSGKTTLLETVVPHFTGTLISTNLTATTRHALFGFVGSTNAFPVWFDEYRPGARKETMLELEQMLRDAYTSQGSAKGGMGEGWAEVITVQAACPLIVSGEDSFSETSHTERMVLLHLPSAGRSAAALQELTAIKTTGFPQAYLSWLHDGLRDGWIHKIENYEFGPPDLPHRHRKNLGVLDLGWRLLAMFMDMHGGAPLGSMDLSLVIGEAVQTSAFDVIEEALMWVEAEVEGGEFCIVKDGKMYLRIQNFVNYIQRSGFKLPGGAKAITRHLEQYFGASPAKHYFLGKQSRCYELPWPRL